MELCKKIDVHAHVTVNREFEYVDDHCVMVSPEELLEIYDKIGVDYGVLQPLISPEALNMVYPTGNTARVAKEHPDRFFWFCGIDPRSLWNRPDTDFSDMIRFFKEKGAIGMGELTANLPIDDPRMENLMVQCAAAGLPITIHIGPQVGNCYGIVDELGLPKLEAMLLKHPELKIIGHSQPFWAEIDAGLTQETRGGYPTGKVTEGRLAKILRKCPNLYCDLSAQSCYRALTRDPDYAYGFIEEFADRLMYAIDYCNPTNVHTYAMAKWLDDSALAGKISETNYRKLCRENAIRILHLPIR